MVYGGHDTYSCRLQQHNSTLPWHTSSPQAECLIAFGPPTASTESCVATQTWQPPRSASWSKACITFVLSIFPVAGVSRKSFAVAFSSRKTPMKVAALDCTHRGNALSPEESSSWSCSRFNTSTTQNSTPAARSQSPISSRPVWRSILKRDDWRFVLTTMLRSTSSAERLGRRGGPWKRLFGIGQGRGIRTRCKGSFLVETELRPRKFGSYWIFVLR